LGIGRSSSPFPFYRFETQLASQWYFSGTFLV